MGDTTPVYGIPYPEPTDQVMDGADNMKDIAEAVETLIQGLDVAQGGLLVRGGVDTSLSTDGGGRFTVALPAGMTTALACVVTIHYASGGVNPPGATVASADGDGVRTFWLHDADGTVLSSVGVHFSWIMVGVA
jgi:hypothetical protein